MINSMAIWLSVILIISIIINVFMFWYLRKLLSKFLFISQNLADLVLIVKNYKDHLNKVYGMEMFYGDETLKFLIEHTKSFIDVLGEYEDVYEISIPPEPEIEQEEYEEETTGTIINEKENVFYAGTRRGDN